MTRFAKARMSYLIAGVSAEATRASPTPIAR